MKDANEETRAELFHGLERKKAPRSQPNLLLRQVRKERFWSQANLAERIGVSNETISRWENGVNSPQPEQLQKLCEAFSKTSAELGYPQRPVSQELEEIVEVKSPPTEPIFIKQKTLQPRFRRPRAVTVGISCLLIALMVFGIIRLTPAILATRCGGTFFDSKLDAQWTWINPGEKATYHLTPAGLTLSAPPHSDLNPSHDNLNAPRLLRPISGNFTVETQLVFRPHTNFQSSGILLWQDSTTFLHFERGFGGKKSGVFLQEWDHAITPITITQLGQDNTIAGTVQLRIQRQGDHITTSWRELDQAWQSGGDTILHFDTLFIGVDLIDQYNNLQATTASYSYFRVLCLK